MKLIDDSMKVIRMSIFHFSLPQIAIIGMNYSSTQFISLQYYCYISTFSRLDIQPTRAGGKNVSPVREVSLKAHEILMKFCN